MRLPDGRKRNSSGRRNRKNGAREAIVGRGDFDIFYAGCLILGQVRDLDVRYLCRRPGELNLVLQETRWRGANAPASAGIANGFTARVRCEPRPRAPVALGPVEIST